jgi:hypothetical protein
MAKHKLEDLGVQAKETIKLKGTVTFAQIVNKVEGESLKKAQERAKARNGIIPEKPYYTISIEDVSVDGDKDSPFAKYYAERVYKNKMVKMH